MGTVSEVNREGPLLRLRPIAASDTQRIHEWAEQPEACRYQPWGPNSYADTQAFVAAAVEAWATDPQQRWAWVAVDPSNLVVGNGEVKLRGKGRAEISYAVHIELWGQGIGSAIGELLTSWAFTHLVKLERLEATCDPRNVASEAVLRHLGMTYEGTLRHVRRIRDGWRDSKVFSILRSEWAASQLGEGRLRDGQPVLTSRRPMRRQRSKLQINLPPRWSYRTPGLVQSRLRNLEPEPVGRRAFSDAARKRPVALTKQQC